MDYGAHRVFLDLSGIEGFSDWFETLTQQVQGSAAVISLVGREWLAALDKTNYPPGEVTKDFVRFEIAEALRRNVPVLPVLLDDASMPNSDQLPMEMQGLLRRHAMDLHSKRFPEEAAAISKQLRKILAETQKDNGVAPWKVAAISVVTLVAGVVVGPTVMTRIGAIEPISDRGLLAALGEAKRGATEADAGRKAALYERDQAIGAKEAAEKEARRASETLVSERSQREVVEGRLANYQAALQERDQAVRAKEAAEKEVIASRELLASEKSQREAAVIQLVEAAAKLKDLKKQLEDTQAVLSAANERAKAAGTASTEAPSKPLTIAADKPVWNPFWDRPSPPAPMPSGGYWVSVKSAPDEKAIERDLPILTEKYKSVLGDTQFSARIADLGAKGITYRAVAGPLGTRQEAMELCQKIKGIGGDKACYVTN